MSDTRQIIESQRPLLEALARADRGELDVPGIKPFGACFGVYPQRDDRVMTRVRVTGGVLPRERLRLLAGIAGEAHPAFVHFTSRMAIQFHGLSPASAALVVTRCTAGGLPFRGGGGDTFRNVVITPDAGIAPDGTDDLAPFARYLADLVFGWDEAFHLPRKIKIGFSTAADSARALRQDLGFIVVGHGGPTPRDCTNHGSRTTNHGFRVVGGGGFGRNPALAIPLLDFIPVSEVARATRAMIELFSEHGNRQDRGHARIRYLVKDLGPEAFRRLYLEYYNRLEGRVFPPPPAAAAFPAPTPDPQAASREPQAARSAAWRALATAPTRFPGCVSVTLFIPRGDLSVAGFTALADLVERFEIPEVRLTMGPEVLIPVFPECRLPELHAALSALPEDVVFSGFAGHLAVCVGAAICKMGILDTPRLVAPVAAALDEYFTVHPEARTAACIRAILGALRFSGCPNSCTAHEAARFGFQGMKVRMDGVLTEGFFLWRDESAAPMGRDAGEFIPATRLAGRVLELLAGASILQGAR